jgi:hypothetical protein
VRGALRKFAPFEGDYSKARTDGWESNINCETD